jgi:hypothetical protein
LYEKALQELKNIEIWSMDTHEWLSWFGSSDSNK